MSVLERFASLTARTTNINAIGGSSGECTLDELQAVLGLISPHAEMFVSLAYMNHLKMYEVMACSDSSCDRALVPSDYRIRNDLIYLFKVMRKNGLLISQQGRWRPQDKAKVKALAELALGQSVSDDKCDCCKGSATVKRAGLVVPCTVCFGVGKKRLSNKAMGLHVGVSNVAWAKTWDWRYTAMLNICNEWKLEAIRALVRERNALL